MESIAKTRTTETRKRKEKQMGTGDNKEIGEELRELKRWLGCTKKKKGGGGITGEQMIWFGC